MADRDATVGHVEEVMGTVVSFSVLPGPLSRDSLTTALGEACGLLHEVDRVFSTWKPDSPMSRIRRGELDPSHAPPEVGEVLRLCELARHLSEGWFDAWSLPGGVDPTGLVKGWATQRALELIRTAGAPAALVNAGGDVAGHGRPAAGERWRIGIRHPWRAEALACVLEVDDCVATSGHYERGAHLVDPHTGRPAVGAASATVTGPDLALADALATALAVAGPEAVDIVGKIEGYDAYVIASDGTEVATPGITVAAPR